jgi:hypothetical protein
VHAVNEVATLADRTWLRLLVSRDCISRTRTLLAWTGCRLGTSVGGPRTPIAQVRCSPEPLDASARDILAAAYEIGPRLVAGDARALAGWDAPFDDLFDRVCRLHDWDVATGAIYLGALRSALHAGVPQCPWLDDGTPD